jgi:hypothetical protein
MKTILTALIVMSVLTTLTGTASAFDPKTFWGPTQRNLS